jgi:hypothetical protein
MSRFKMEHELLDCEREEYLELLSRLEGSYIHINATTETVELEVLREVVEHVEYFRKKC